MNTVAISIHRLDLIISNAFLLGDSGRRVLIDTGAGLAYSRLRAKLEKHGVCPGGIELVILTHAHPDHAGNAAKLKEDFGAPIAIHTTEADWLRNGTAELYKPCGFFGHLLNQFNPRTFDPCTPDRLLDGNETIDNVRSIGPLRVLHTPGHTPGHLCVEPGCGELFAGDLMRGEMLKGDFVGAPFFVQDRRRLRDSIRRVTEHCPTSLHFGHGKAASGEALHHFDLN